MKIVEAVKKIYPDIQGGFIYWETKQDGSEWENPIDGLAWENTEFEKPTWEQIQAQLGIIELEEAKTSKLAELDKNRNDFCLIPIEHSGNTYATTLEAKNAINFYIASLPTLASAGDYYAANGEKVSLTKADFKALAALIQAREIESRDKREDLLTQINACTTLQEVAAINIDFE